MAKTTALYWNPLQADQAHHWSVIAGTNGLIEQIFLAVDDVTGDFTRLGKCGKIISQARAVDGWMGR